MSRNPILGLNVANLTKPATALSDGAAPAGSVQLAVVFPAAGGFQVIDATGTVITPATSTGAALLAANNTFTGRNTFAPVAATSGSATAFTITGAANTGQTAGTEATDVYVNLSRTVTFAAGAISVQRAVRIAPPTYAFPSASTINTAATFAIDGPPAAGANATITRPLAFGVITGTSRLGGDLQLGANVSLDGPTPTFTTTTANNGMSLVGNGTGTIALTAGAGGSVSLVGAAAGAKLGFFATAPVVQGAAVPAPAGGGTVDAEARAAIVLLIARLTTPGFIAA